MGSSTPEQRSVRLLIGNFEELMTDLLES